MLQKAIEIAVVAHKNQVDKNGQPYIGHVLRVMKMGLTWNERICGVLHDLVEDTNWTFEMLSQEGFPDEIISALKCVTKTTNDEDYNAFIVRVMTNRLAIKVKINDLTDNLDVKRMKQLTVNDLHRINKYLKAYHMLMNMNNEWN
jgi:(p)ppGpp synthase/HD superfamily hydrolase